MTADFEERSSRQAYQLLSFAFCAAMVRCHSSVMAKHSDGTVVMHRDVVRDQMETCIEQMAYEVMDSEVYSSFSSRRVVINTHADAWLGVCIKSNDRDPNDAGGEWWQWAPTWGMSYAFVPPYGAVELKNMRMHGCRLTSTGPLKASTNAYLAPARGIWWPWIVGYQSLRNREEMCNALTAWLRIDESMIPADRLLMIEMEKQACGLS